jgi:hypothetical protein
MARSKRKNLSPDEQDVLDQVQVGLLSKPDEVARCDELIFEHHYLHDATLVGEHLRYAATSRPVINSSAGQPSNAGVGAASSPTMPVCWSCRTVGIPT